MAQSDTSESFHIESPRMDGDKQRWMFAIQRVDSSCFVLTLVSSCARFYIPTHVEKQLWIDDQLLLLRDSCLTFATMIQFTTKIWFPPELRSMNRNG